jgi:hypothetical protein
MTKPYFRSHAQRLQGCESGSRARFPFGTTKARAVIGKTPGYMPGFGFCVIKLVSR